MSEEIKIVYEGGEGEIVEKKSRFIAYVKPVKTPEEATIFIEAIKKKHWDARHNCSAIVIGDNNEFTRCSDDGEPAQTAGKPMLEVLLGENIHNVAVVVTRYFGGVLLGTGGLVRAYQAATKEGLANCVIAKKHKGGKYEITTDYNGIGKLQYIFATNDVFTIDTEYGENVKSIVMIKEEKEKAVIDEIVDATAGKAVINNIEKVSYVIAGEKVDILRD